MEERRLLMAVALSLLLLTAYSLLFPPARPSPTPSPRPPAGSAAVSPAPPRESAPPERAREAAVVPAGPAVADERERRVEARSRELSVAFTNRGARLVSWRLARFADGRGRPEEMVQAAPSGPRPLDLETGDATVDGRLREALFKASSQSLTVPEGGSGTLRFEYAEGDLAADKEITLSDGGYLVALKASVRRGGRPLGVRILWGPGVGNPTPAEREVQGYQPPQGVALVGGSVQRIPAEKLATVRTLEGVRWAGVESHYFAAIFVPPRERGTVSLGALALPAHDDDRPGPVPLVSLDMGVGAEPALLYVGPKDYHVMARAGHQLARVVPVGDWIGPIVVPLISLLRWVHGHVGNYGWSIVVLTIFINLAMAPFRHYSIANGLRMAKIAPEMKVIQERYRKVPLMDPKRQQMQEEMAALYARHGMSMGTQMLVGCLPLLLTMPFLIAFYRVLTVSIELRGAPFLWITDLSQKDPLFLTPVLMGLSMFAMQKMTPTTMDPAQQRIMMIMPIVLAGMFLWAPAGLNLYWLASNLCAIAQQALTLRILKGPAPAAARKRK
ncbi:MAG TPA: membrane protein insertase YidC [Vicinamibacteria bacterium]|nr:membrane protein insertase YidC [Vicinamibacteria bacterium]